MNLVYGYRRLILFFDDNRLLCLVITIFITELYR